MATVLEIIYKIKERESSFNVTDDYKATDELILSTMNDVRGTLIRSFYKNERYIPAEFYQFNCCYEINCVTGGCTYNGEFVPDGENIYTVNLKPRVKDIGGNDISYVGNRNGTFQFDILSFADYNSMDGRVFTKYAPSVTLLTSTELRLKNLPTAGMKFVCIREILEDPTTGCNWDDNETEYPVSSVNKLIEMVIYKLMTSGAADKINNAADDTTPPKIQDQIVAQQQKLQTEGQ